MTEILASPEYLAFALLALVAEVGVLGLRSLRRWYRRRPIPARKHRRTA
jgi:hypothetical protein